MENWKSGKARNAQASPGHTSSEDISSSSESSSEECWSTQLWQAHKLSHDSAQLRKTGEGGIYTMVFDVHTSCNCPFWYCLHPGHLCSPYQISFVLTKSWIEMTLNQRNLIFRAVQLGYYLCQSVQYSSVTVWSSRNAGTGASPVFSGTEHMDTADSKAINGLGYGCTSINSRVIVGRIHIGMVCNIFGYNHGASMTGATASQLFTHIPTLIWLIYVPRKPLANPHSWCSRVHRPL